MAAQRDMAWVGVDIGKTHHWVCVVGADGKTLLSVKIANDEAEIVTLLANAGSLAEQLIWAVDIIGAPSALLLALLSRAGHSVRYASGRVVAAMSAAYAGEGKTDAKDAYVIQLPALAAAHDLASPASTPARTHTRPSPTPLLCRSSGPKVGHQDGSPLPASHPRQLR